jgi:peptide/nickel transport system permease protein
MRYLAWRVFELAIVMVGLSVLIFALSRILPGDPIRFALGPTATPEQIADLTRQLGLDRPIWEQYWILIRSMAQGDFGLSLSTQRPIVEDIVVFLPASIELALVALVLAVALGVLLGVWSALARDRWPDYLIRLGAFVLVAIPGFWLALMLQTEFGFTLEWLPPFGRVHADRAPPPEATGFFLIDSLLARDFGLFLHCLAHIVLPAFVLAAAPLAMILRLVRARMLEELARDYVMTQRANGMPLNLLVYKYTLRNAFSAALTVIGLLFGFFIGGAFVVETVFSWPGIGRFGVRALQFKDFNAIITVAMVVGLGYAIANTIVALLYGWLDPRLRA